MDVNICFLVVCQTMTITFKKCFVVGLGYVTYKAYPCNYCHMKLFVHFRFCYHTDVCFFFSLYEIRNVIIIIYSCGFIKSGKPFKYLLFTTDLLFVTINRSLY